MTQTTLHPSHRDHALVALAASAVAAERKVTTPYAEAAIRFGIRLRYARQARGLGQVDLSILTDRVVTQGTISRLEAGRTFPRLDTIHRLAAALDVAPAELLDP